MTGDGKAKSAIERHAFLALKADIDKGLADIAAGRVKDLDM